MGGGKFLDQGNQVIFATMAPIEGHKLTDYGDIVGKEGWKEILDRFKGKKLVLDYIREDSPSLPVLRQWGEARQQWVAPGIDLPESFAAYLAGLERKDRHELKRKMNKEAGEITVQSGEVDIDELVRLVKLGSGEKRQFMGVEMERWFRQMTRVMRPYTKLFMLDNKAAYLGFEWGEELYLYNGGYDPQAGYAVGIATLGKIIEWAIGKKYKKVDYLRGDEPYKYDLGAKDLQLYQLTVLRHT